MPFLRLGKLGPKLVQVVGGVVSASNCCCAPPGLSVIELFPSVYIVTEEADSFHRMMKCEWCRSVKERPLMAA